jgi:hypothetical protein
MCWCCYKVLVHGKKWSKYKKMTYHKKSGVVCFSYTYSAVIQIQLTPDHGRARRAIAQAVNRWLPTAAAQVRVPAERVGFVVDKVAVGQIFSEYFGFSYQSSFHQFLHHHNHPGLA